MRFTGPLRLQVLDGHGSQEEWAGHGDQVSPEEAVGNAIILATPRVPIQSMGRPRAGKAPIRAVRIGPGDRPPDPGRPAGWGRRRSDGGAVVKKCGGAARFRGMMPRFRFFSLLINAMSPVIPTR